MKTILMSLLVFVAFAAGAKEILVDCEEQIAELTYAKKRNQARMQALEKLAKKMDQNKPEVEEQLMGLTIDLIREGNELQVKISKLNKDCK